MILILAVDADEIRRLGKRFRKLDLDNSGALSIDEFMSLPELQQNPLVQRVIDIFDADGNGEVDFKEFIQGVSQFSVKVSIRKIQETKKHISSKKFMLPWGKIQFEMQISVYVIQVLSLMFKLKICLV